MIFHLHRLLLLFMLFAAASPCLAQEQQGGKAGKMSRRERLRLADSLRLEMRRAADEGRLAVWGDSILRAKHSQGKMSKGQYEKLLKRLRLYDRHLHHGDSLLSAKYSKINVDTGYIVRPRGVRWTVKVRGNLSGATIKTDGRRGGEPFDGRVESDYRGTMSFAVTYRGLSLGFALNPAKLAGKNKDSELNLVSYGNKFGFDAAYLSSKTYSGRIFSNGEKAAISKGKVSQEAINFNAYYAFNGRRYSTPAAFTQSYVQKKSAGSVMAGVSLDAQKVDIAPNEALRYGHIAMRIFDIGLGVGYGYNFVVGKHWLLHISSVPTFDVFVKAHVSEDDQRINMSYHFPSVIITGRAAAVYSWRQKFVGATMVYTSSSLGSHDVLHVMRDKWRLRLFYGFRF